MTNKICANCRADIGDVRDHLGSIAPPDRCSLDDNRIVFVSSPETRRDERYNESALLNSRPMFSGILGCNSSVHSHPILKLSFNGHFVVPKALEH
jgi:hypothetical protein